jgi:hypothetical protein
VTAERAGARLERRARALLRAYPAGYRRDRGEEIIGTLLEATPPGRSVPLARDAWALLNGGRNARAARNRALSAPESLRLAALLGLAIFVGRTVAYPTLFFYYDSWTGFWGAIAAGLLAVLTPWMRHRAVSLACVVPAGALYAYHVMSVYPWTDKSAVSGTAAFLVILAALALWRGQGARPPASWAWMPCLVPVLTAVPALHLGDTEYFWPAQPFWYATALLAVVAAGWLATDARPLLGVGVGVLLMYLILVLGTLSHPAGLLSIVIDAESLKWVVAPLVLSALATAAMARLVRRRAATR